MRRGLALLVYALGSLRRRARRSVALALGLALATGLYASAVFLADALRAEYRANLDAAPDLTVQRLVAGRPALVPEDALTDLEALPGVRSVRPRLWGYLFVEAIEANVVVAAVEAGPELAPALATGEPLGPADALGDERPALVGPVLAERLALFPGDGLAIPDARGELVLLRVRGVFDPATALQAADLVLVHEATARRLLGVPEGEVTDLAIALAAPEEAPVVSAAVAERLPMSRVVDRVALERAYELTFDGRAGLVAALLLPMLAALLLMAWDRFSGLGESERREIGVLKAIGWGTGDVLLARLVEALVVTAGGVSLGLLAAYGYAFLLGAPGMSGALFGWSTLYPEPELAPATSLAQLFSLAGLVVGPLVAVALVPAWRASMLDPDEVIRGG
ncbi:MAG: ABC transporter permease [Myxococcota bacterium]